MAPQIGHVLPKRYRQHASRIDAAGVYYPKGITVKLSDAIIPAITLVFSVGVAFQGLQEAQATTDDLSERVQNLEIKQAETGSTKVMVEQNTERLERLELIVEKMADQQIKMLANQAAVCQSLGVSCSR